MKPPTILSIAAAGLCLILSIWLFFVGTTNQNLQADMQKTQEELQTHQQAVQLAQQQLQAQQDQINAGTKLAQEVGPAVLRDLGGLAVQSKNESIKKILGKYGVTVNENAAEATPKPAPANP